MTSEQLASHLRVDQYGDFRLTKAIRPAPTGGIVPCEGYRREVYRDAGLRVPVLAAAVSREHLFEVFLDLLAPLGDLGETVDVVFESSHDSGDRRSRTREQIDLPVLLSHFCDEEDLLLEDGCGGVSVLATDAPAEVQFDEHKLLIVYAQDPRPFEVVLRRHGIVRNDDLRLVSEGEHLHGNDPEHADAFDRLCARVGTLEPAGNVPW